MTGIRTPIAAVKIKHANHYTIRPNIDKTNYIIFHPYNKPMKQHITIKINNNVINETEFIKYLGVFIDSTLRWKHQISNISKKISQARHYV